MTAKLVLMCLCLVIFALTVNSCVATVAAGWANAKSTLSAIPLILAMVIAFVYWLDKD